MWACRVSHGITPLPRPVHTKPNRIFFVSAKFQSHRSRRENNNYNYNHYDYDNDDDDDDDVQVTPISTETEETGEQQQVPRGSDILRALQRATVRKHNKMKKKKQQKKLLLVPDSKEKEAAEEAFGSSSSSIGDVDAPVKPLRIRSNWSTRLDELELRLKDLLHI